MQVRHQVSYQMPKIYKAYKICETITAKGKAIADQRVKIMEFYDEYGIEATKKAFGVSKSSVYNWKKLLRESKGKLSALIPASRSPINKRKSQIHPLVKEFIKNYRNAHPKTGQDKIKPLLDAYCKKEQIKTISAGSIALVIKQLKADNELKEYTLVRYSGTTGKVHAVKPKKKRKKQRRKGYRPKKPGDLIQLDTVTKFIDGLKYYIITAIDLNSKFAFALPYTTLNSSNATDFMEKLKQIAPFDIKRIQTDNGLEFEKHFRHYVKNEQITHFHNYPKRPQSNGSIERFNRTIQESFINWNLHLLDKPKEFAKALIDWLLWYNLERVHCSIGLKTPMNFILEEKFGSNFRDSPKTIKKSNMLLDYTED